MSTDSQPPVVLIPEDPTSPSKLLRHWTHIYIPWHRHIHIHLIKNNKNKPLQIKEECFWFLKTGTVPVSPRSRRFLDHECLNGWLMYYPRKHGCMNIFSFSSWLLWLLFLKSLILVYVGMDFFCFFCMLPWSLCLVTHNLALGYCPTLSLGLFCLRFS